jgi:hypothetical protein
VSAPRKRWRWAAGLAALAVLAGAVLAGPSFADGKGKGGKAADSETPALKVKVDTVYIDKTLDVLLGQQMVDEVMKQDTKDPLCIEAAVFLAQHAAGVAGIKKGVLDLMAQTAKAIEDAATLTGAKSVAKVAALAGTIVQAYQMEDPAQALGDALVNETAGWLSGKVKTDDKDLDPKLKDGLKDAGKKLAGYLFPKGDNKVSNDHDDTYGPCKMTVTSYYEAPQGQSPGALKVFIRGECNCQPIPHGPFTPGAARYEGVKLKDFYLTAHVPVEGMDYEIQYGAKAFSVPDMLEKAEKLKAAIEGALAGKGTDPVKDAKGELDKQVDAATKGVQPILVIRPKFANHIIIDNFKVECGNCDAPTYTTGGGGSGGHTTGGGTATGGGVTNGPPVV